MNKQLRGSFGSNPVRKIKNAGSSYGGPNTPKAIKNAVAMKPKSPGKIVPKNSVTCMH